MIIYQADKSTFLKDVREREIDELIHDAYRQKTGRSVGVSELRSWRESLKSMANVLEADELPGTLGVAIEFVLPQMLKRIDVVLAGLGKQNERRAVIVELKQWEQAEVTEQDGVVRTRVGGREGPHVHPSYQAWSYAAFLRGFNEAVYEGGIELAPCAYLHNYKRDGKIDAERYAPYLKEAPLFAKGEKDDLRAFIQQQVSGGHGTQVLDALERSRIRPSKALAEAVKGIVEGHQEFVLLDDQKQVFEAALAAARQASPGTPRVVIIEGGPGTGKSVVAVHLVAALLAEKQSALYVSKNAAPRKVYAEKLGKLKRNKVLLANLFIGPDRFMSTATNEVGTIVVDESHRLTEKGGFYGNQGDHSVKDIIRSTPCSIFFIDEDQRVTLNDIGSKEVIRHYAALKGAVVEEYELASQFRCSGSNGYLAWLDDVLDIRPTANTSLAGSGYDFQVFDDPEAMHQAIKDRNQSNRARVVAGYCWPWLSKKDSSAPDIVIGEYRRQWNLDTDGSLWIISPNSVEQVGCVHTCQGLEVDYIGVIIGPDLVLSQGKLETNPRARDRHDKTMKGYVGWSEKQPAEAHAAAARIIKNTYRTLMTRGMKGCFVYCTDPELRTYLRQRT